MSPTAEFPSFRKEFGCQPAHEPHIASHPIPSHPAEEREREEEAGGERQRQARGSATNKYPPLALRPLPPPTNASGGRGGDCFPPKPQARAPSSTPSAQHEVSLLLPPTPPWPWVGSRLGRFVTCGGQRFGGDPLRAGQQSRSLACRGAVSVYSSLPHSSVRFEVTNAMWFLRDGTGVGSD
jgi:hypothetical protein